MGLIGREAISGARVSAIFGYLTKVKIIALTVPGAANATWDCHHYQRSRNVPCHRCFSPHHLTETCRAEPWLEARQQFHVELWGTWTGAADTQPGCWSEAAQLAAFIQGKPQPATFVPDEVTEWGVAKFMQPSGASAPASAPTARQKPAPAAERAPRTAREDHPLPSDGDTI